MWRRRLLLGSLVFTLAGSCSRPDGPADLGTRAVLIGIDGADWKIIDELAAAGRMPNLQRLRDAGVSGPLETLNDIALSPVIWTSIATGKTAAKHGISWFMVDQPDGSRAPVRSTNRKVRAIWNILGDRGRWPVVLGWWATYPAEDVGKGVVISDALGFHGFGATAREGDDGRKTYPPDRFAGLYALVPPEQQLSFDFVRRFVHLTAEEYRTERFDPGRFPHADPANPIHLFQEYAVTAQGYAAIAEELLAKQRYDLFMVYFEQVDSFSHLFMKYDPPLLPWVDPQAAARYRDVVREWYVYQDELLGRLLARIDLETTAVFVVSDHGFKSGDRRIRSEDTVDVKRAHLDHEQHGIFVAAGPQIQRAKKLEGASVLDVTPTLLRYLGFPVGKDMDGKVLEEIFAAPFTTRNAIRYVATYEPEKPATPTTAAAAAAEPVKLSAEELAEKEQALRSLGYIGGGSGKPAASGAPATGPATAGASPAGPSGESSPELHNNMGQIHLRNGDLDKARREFEQALEIDPRNADALINIASVLAAQGRTLEAEHAIQRALQVNPDSVAALSQLADLRRDQGNLAEAVRLYRQAVAIDGSLPFVHIGLGDVLQRAGRFAEAEREFRKVLELDPDSFKAYYNLGVTYGNQGKSAEAATFYKKALEIGGKDPEASKAMNNLGYMALQHGRTAEAISWFEQAVKAAPGSLEANFNLGVQYFEKGKLAEAIKLLEQAAQIAPNHELVNERLGLAYLEANRAQDAFRTFTLVRRLYPKNWSAPLGLAVVRAATGKPDDARQLLAEAIRLGGPEARARAAGFPALKPLLSAAQPPN